MATSQPQKKISPLQLILTILIVLTAIYLIFVIIYQTNLRRRPDTTAQTILQENSSSIYKDKKGNLVFLPPQPASQGLIFYSGAFVDPASYAQFLHQLANQGFFIVVPSFPFNLASLSSNKAQSIIDHYPEITEWTGLGHSLGGVAISKYTSSHPDQLQHLILLASYPQHSLKNYSGSIATILGDQDIILNEEERQKAEAAFLPGKAALIIIPGANHNQFGNYLNTPPDGQPSLTAIEQQAQVTAIIKSLLQNKATSIQPTVTVIDSDFFSSSE